MVAVQSIHHSQSPLQPSLVASNKGSSPDSPMAEKKIIRSNFLTNIQSEPKYLLRKCLQYHWRAVLVCCSVLVDEIFSDEAASNDFLEAGKRQLLATDPWGNNALHAVCYFKPPHAVVAALLRAASSVPTGPIQLHAAFTTTDDKATPLTIACREWCSVQVIQELLQSQYDGTSVTSTPYSVFIPSANESLHISSKPQPCRIMQQQQQQLDLHNALTALIQRYQMLLQVPSNRNKEPQLENVTSLPNSASTHQSPPSTSPLFDTLWTKVDLLLQAPWVTPYLHECCNDLHVYHDNADDDWSTTTTTTIATATTATSSYTTSSMSSHDLQSFSQFSSSSSFPLILHRAAYLSECVPPVLTDLIVRCSNTNDLTCTYQGMAPLHFALTANATRIETQEHQQMIYQRTYFINKLLEVHPSIANCPMPVRKYSTINNDKIDDDDTCCNLDDTICQAYVNRMPIFQAIESGLQWHIEVDKGGRDTCSATMNGTPIHNVNSNLSKHEETRNQMEHGPSGALQSGPLQKLWKCAPQVIQLQDPITGLYPFMLAATVVVGADMDQSTAPSSDPIAIENHGGMASANKQEIFELDTIYSLLRLNPEPVMMAV